MIRSSSIRLVILGIIALGLLVSCQGAPAKDDPSAVVDDYIQALVAKDVNQMISLSCAEWEARARQEYDSFAAVKLTLNDLKCQEAGTDGSYTLVSCTGVIIASYGAEDLLLDLKDQVYRTAQESGEWRVCGY